MVFAWTAWTCRNPRLMEVLIRTTGITTSVGSGIRFAALTMTSQHGTSPSWVGERRWRLINSQRIRNSKHDVYSMNQNVEDHVPTSGAGSRDGFQITSDSSWCQPYISPKSLTPGCQIGKRYIEIGYRAQQWTCSQQRIMVGIPRVYSGPYGKSFFN